MTQKQLHLVRHGEVENPDGVLYGRLPGYSLSKTGHEMAELAAKNLRERGRHVSALYASPLLRAQQSAAPIAQEFDLSVRNEPRIIEPTNRFEGKPKVGKSQRSNNHATGGCSGIRCCRAGVNRTRGFNAACARR